MTQLRVLAFSGVAWKHTFWELMTRCTQQIRDFFYENALYKFTLDLHANLLKPDGIIVIDEDLDIWTADDDKVMLSWL